jgi:RNA-directed DNA polymerase
MGKPAATDRPCLRSLSHSFTLDFLAGFQYQTDAEFFRESLGDRLGEFHLELAEEKTRHLEFGRYARTNAYRRGEKPKDFEFLGMTFFCGKTRHGVFKVKRKTSRKKLRQSLARLADWLRRYRNLLPTGDLLRQTKAQIQGHLNYYAITDNSESCQLYLHLTRRVLFKWLNRRSQRKSYTWDGFRQALRHVGWPQARVRVNLSPFARLNG